MQKLSLDEVLKATGGKLLFGPRRDVENITIDSRKLGHKCFFVALKGDRFDGHDFLNDALKECSGAIVSIPPVTPDSSKTIIHVDNTLKALQDIARLIRKKNGFRVLGITGTNGKTTTKELAAAIISKRFSVLKNSGNLNNHIGLPLSMLELEASKDVAILEMGASAQGDIKELCKIAEPDFGLLTNIGYAHIEGFKDIAVVRQTKMELLDAVNSAVVNADDEFLMEGISSYKGSLLTFGINNQADVMATHIVLGTDGSEFTLKTPSGSTQVSLTLPGVFNIYNALAAASAGELFGISLEETSQALKEFSGVPMRMEPMAFCGCTVISDVYNANPNSMEEAIKELVRLSPSRSIAVLGDMLELGTYSETAHRKLGKWMGGLGIELFIAVGEEMRAAAVEFQAAGGTAITAENSEQAGELLRAHIKEGDTVMLKGSRSMKMELVIKGEEAAANNLEGGERV
jgi:UDP-N-acetylmuramoyl-tripeptide--D-alanyl-D-alanine ligase